MVYKYWSLNILLLGICHPIVWCFKKRSIRNIRRIIMRTDQSKFWICKSTLGKYRNLKGKWESMKWRRRARNRLYLGPEITRAKMWRPSSLKVGGALRNGYTLNTVVEVARVGMILENGKMISNLSIKESSVNLEIMVSFEWWGLKPCYMGLKKWR